MIKSIDNNEMTEWLARVAQTIDRSAREPARAEAIAMLDGAGEVLPVLAQLALLADCLRVAQLASEADGQVDAEELERMHELAAVAAPRYAAALPHYAGVTPKDFLPRQREDARMFGHAHPTKWIGLQLVRHIEKHSRNASPLRDHERMLSRIMEHVFAGRDSAVERQARRDLRALFERQTVVGLDPRAIAFCRPDGPEVFTSVAHGSQIHARDPYDVESIHAEAREVFQRQVERAVTPARHEAGHGRTLLILGESGSGKTHLLRALRAQVHANRLGYVGYLQMTSEVGDYARYALRNLIDSMERPYDAPTASESALMYLSNGLTEGRVAIPLDELERLRTAELTELELDAVIGGVIDRIVRTEGLDQLEVDILHALLLLQRRDPALQRRVVKYLRCEPLSNHDRALLGGLASRDQPEDPLRTIKQLAKIQYELHMAALVLMVDQIEEAIPDGQTVTRLQQAFDSLRAIADAVPSAVVVISCLDDVYTAVRPKLSRSLVDRLENDPPLLRLTSQRQTDEIEQMLVVRLEKLYDELDVAWREDEPLFPFTPAQLAAVSKFRARDCLARFRDFHAACIANGTLLGASAPTSAKHEDVVFDDAAPPASPPPARDDVERAWHEARTGQLALPEDDAGILALLARALRDAAHDAELEISTEVETSSYQISIRSPGSPPRVLALCNRNAQGGHLGRQLEGLRRLGEAGTQPFAVRSSDFQFKPRSATAQQIGELIKVGGRTVVLGETDLRALVALEQLARTNPAVAGWRKRARPLEGIGVLRDVLALDLARNARPAAAPPAPPVSVTLPAPPAAAPIPRPTPAPLDADQSRLGVTTSLRAEPRHLGLEQVKSHVTFIGGTGSGKTTAALNLIEQLLERGVSALLLDRKGDLSRYASEAWWADPAAPDRDRRRALRDRIAIELFTPGNSAGRPLRLPLIPSLAAVDTLERNQVAQFAANGLATMMGYGSSSTQKNKLAVLQCAIALHVGERDVTLDVLLDTINRPDPVLLQSVQALQRHFATLSEDLQSLRIQRGDLLTGDGPLLDVGELLPPRGEKPKLSIINNAAIAEIPVLEFWVSRLLADLARLARKRPSKTLQAVAFFDEADAYVPAIGSPPTKEPMFDLLRRARSGGLGVLLATQNPGDFDYKARDNIATWLVGKVSQPRAIEKMRNLIGPYPNVGPRLANQLTGHFFVLASGAAVEIRTDRSMMQTEQLSEAEVVELARGAPTAYGSAPHPARG